MKKMVLSVIWLAIAGVFTTMTMSACSDDEENNSSTCPYDPRHYFIDNSNYDILV